MEKFIESAAGEIKAEELDDLLRRARSRLGGELTYERRPEAAVGVAKSPLGDLLVAMTVRGIVLVHYLAGKRRSGGDDRKSSVAIGSCGGSAGHQGRGPGDRRHLSGEAEGAAPQRRPGPGGQVLFSRKGALASAGSVWRRRPGIQALGRGGGCARRRAAGALRDAQKSGADLVLAIGLFAFSRRRWAATAVERGAKRTRSRSGRLRSSATAPLGFLQAWRGGTRKENRTAVTYCGTAAQLDESRTLFSAHPEDAETCAGWGARSNRRLEYGVRDEIMGTGKRARGCAVLVSENRDLARSRNLYELPGDPATRSVGFYTWLLNWLWMSSSGPASALARMACWNSPRFAPVARGS